ncbi:hypothetical protein HaLaN_04142 [Haematococcus lacustris]|uniref:Uncharacterized protein n=1 Tax=Haematococcus lacustris TaxID=44745 RepID=A0A699YQ39_HAELA|nr:hypothetical protein HaLaN_04142 [Haematococcus lacustris]
MAAPSPDDPNALGSDGLPKFAHTTTQTFGGKESTVAQLNKEAGRHRMSGSQEQQVGVVDSWSMTGVAWLGGCKQGHDGVEQQPYKEVARSQQQGMTWSKSVSGRPLDMSGPQCPA